MTDRSEINAAAAADCTCADVPARTSDARTVADGPAHTADACTADACACADGPARTCACADDDKLPSVFDALARNFQNVFWIDLAGGMAKVLKLDGYITEGLDRNDHQYFPYESVLGRYLADRVHPDDRASLYDAICLESIREAFGAQEREELVGNYHILVDGETHSYQYNYYKMSGGFVVCGFQNIDAIIEETVARERLQREKEEAYKRELEEQVKIFDNLARNFRNVYVANIAEGTARILKLGDGYDLEAVTKLVGQTFSFQDILDEWIARRVHPDDRERLARMLALPHLRRVFAEREEYEGTYRSLDGGVMHNYQFRLSKLDEEGNVIAGFQIIDAMIEEHLAEDRLRREKEETHQRELIAAKEEADRANRAKTDFLLRMSHDIRTPLNGIVGMLDIAERFSDDLAKQAECREKVRESSQILLDLVNDVLDMSKLESGEIVLEHVPFDLGDMSREVYNAMYTQAKGRGLEIVQVCSDVPHTNVFGSPTHCKRLFMNLISNAVKYNKEGGKIYLGGREASFEGGVMTLEFTCRDTGIGMSPEFQEHLFEPFAQENADVHATYGGTGLGMSIAKSIVDKMGGSISFESVRGEGTTFTVLLPFEVDDSQKAANPADGAHEAASIEGLRVLLVEDNDLNLEIAQFLLEEEGALVEVARDGREAVDVFAASAPGHFDVVLMDVMMPVMNGYDATRAIRATGRPDAGSVPIVAMTANAFAEDKIQAREAGMTAHVAKPLDMGLLMETMVRLVRER